MCDALLAWKKAFGLNRHWRLHARRSCPQCGGRLSKAYPASTQHYALFCPVRQAAP